MSIFAKIRNLLSKVKAEFVPSNKMVYLLIDWKSQHVVLSLQFPDKEIQIAVAATSHASGVELSPQVLEYLCDVAIMNIMSCVESDGLSKQNAVREVASWEFITSATGRAHNAIPESYGMHITRRVRETLRQVQWAKSNS